MRIRQDTATAICTLPFSLSAAIGVHRTAEKAGSKGGILRPTIVSQSRLASPGRHPKILNTSISRRWPAAARATHADGPVFPIVARDHQIPERQLHEVRACLAHLFEAPRSQEWHNIGHRRQTPPIPRSKVETFRANRSATTVFARSATRLDFAVGRP